MECKYMKKKICILTEARSREMYLLEADDFNEIVNDWNGDRRFIPEMDATVYFASYDGKPINPYAYKDFMSLLMHIREELA